MEELKIRQKNAKFILYNWDSIINKKISLALMMCFDSIFTFDKSDLSIDREIKFRPLFYISEYEEITPKLSEDFDIAFIGTAHSDRYPLLKNIENQFKEKGLKGYFYFYFPSKLFFWFRKIFDKSFSIAKYSSFSFNPLLKKEVIDIITKTKCVLDIQHPKQTGLTMRTIEILGAKRKLITTNRNIREYDFYDDSNILIIDRQNPLIDFSFLSTEYKNINSQVYEKYSLRYWVKEIFLSTN
jgi:spore maturation protein CgeB